MTRLLTILLMVGLAPAAFAQAGAEDQLSLVVTVAPFAHVVSLDDQDGAADATLVFDFAPGLDEANPTVTQVPAAITIEDRISFATNLDFPHQVDLAVEAATPGDWNDLAITVTPGAVETVDTSTSTDGVAGSCGTAGSEVTLTADALEVALASGVTLCHANQTVTYEVQLDDTTADEADRAFDVTYTILQSEAPAFPGGG